MSPLYLSTVLHVQDLKLCSPLALEFKPPAGGLCLSIIHESLEKFCIYCKNYDEKSRNYTFVFLRDENPDQC